MEAHKDEVLEGEIVNEEETTDLVPVRQTASALDIPTEQFKAALDRRGANRKALLEWIKEALVEGVDFGSIHVVSKKKCDKGNRCTNKYHWSKPVLFKPGAEKICGMLGLVASFPNMREYEKMAVAGKKIEIIMLRCELHQGETFMGEGAGARSVSQEYGDINKAIKMCQKSAHIDATLKTAGLSEMFTQDLDDMQPKEDPQPTPQQKADKETKDQDWTISIWDTLKNSGHPDINGVWNRAGNAAHIKGAAKADTSQQKKFKEYILSEIDDWRASEDEPQKMFVNADQVLHLIETAKAASDDLGSAKRVLDFCKGTLKNFDLQRLEHLTVDEYEGLIEILNTQTGGGS
jgi:hypothetical protein